jgi:hypothetical protein
MSIAAVESAVPHRAVATSQALGSPHGVSILFSRLLCTSQGYGVGNGCIFRDQLGVLLASGPHVALDQNLRQERLRLQRLEAKNYLA